MKELISVASSPALLTKDLPWMIMINENLFVVREKSGNFITYEWQPRVNFISHIHLLVEYFS